MMPITIKLESIDAQIGRNLAKQQQRVQKAIGAAAIKLGESIVTKGRADISSAGKFGPRWTTSGLTYDIATEGNIRTISIREAVPYWRVFQDGAVIQGKPLLYFEPTKPIFSRGELTNPKVISVPSVRIPKKFHLVEIAVAESKTFGALYRMEMASSE